MRDRLNISIPGVLARAAQAGARRRADQRVDRVSDPAQVNMQFIIERSDYREKAIIAQPFAVRDAGCRCRAPERAAAPLGRLEGRKMGGLRAIAFSSFLLHAQPPMRREPWETGVVQTVV